MIGQTFNNLYKITSRLGKGAMGTVYLAINTHNNHQVALKVIASDLAIEPEMLKRFKHEGEALRQLKHPNIVGFIDAFQHEETQAIVMEYIPGGSLYELLKKGALPIEYARQLGLDLCDALIRAHRLNIIHRDIKPENILIDKDGTPKLADFGVARLSQGTRMTRSGMQVGTPYYMAPEAWKGEKLDSQADIWSLGVVLFEMLSGKVPFDGDTAASVMTKVLTSPPPDLKKIRSDIPTDLINIVKQMLKLDKKQRYQTLREVAVDLERGQKINQIKSKISSTRIVDPPHQLTSQIQNRKRISTAKRENTEIKTDRLKDTSRISNSNDVKDTKYYPNPKKTNNKYKAFVYVIENEGVPLYHFLPTSNNWTVWLEKKSKLRIVDEIKDVKVSIGKYGYFIEVIDNKGNHGFVPAISVSFNRN